VPETRTIRLPVELCTAAETKFHGVFGNIEELLVFILKELTNDDALQADQAEQQIIEERLKDLGYL